MTEFTRRQLLGLDSEKKSHPNEEPLPAEVQAQPKTESLKLTRREFNSAMAAGTILGKFTPRQWLQQLLNPVTSSENTIPNETEASSINEFEPQTIEGMQVFGSEQNPIKDYETVREIGQQ